jgi:hypothetical protein
MEIVRWHVLSLDVAGVDGVEEVGELVLERAQQLSAADGVEAHAARIALTGRGPVHAELARAEALEQLEEACRERLAGLHPPWALEALRDETAPELDLGALRSGGGLVGEILEQAGDPSALKELWAEEELAKLARVLERAKVPTPKEEGAALLSEATAAVVEQLLEEGT